MKLWEMRQQRLMVPTPAKRVSSSSSRHATSLLMMDKADFGAGQNPQRSFSDPNLEENRFGNQAYGNP